MASSTARRRRLGAELRRWRETRGMTQADVAERVDMSADQVLRIERGRAVRISVHVIGAICDVLDVDRAERVELLAMTKGARQRNWWTSYRDVLTDKFAGLEDSADVITEYNALTIPGLMQTAAYARAVIKAGNPRLADPDVERRVEARLRRGAILERDAPPELWAVIDESVLHRLIGGGDALAEQLTRLEEIAHRPGVTIQILRMDAGAHGLPDGNIILFAFDDSDPIVVVESMAGTHYLEEPDDVYRVSALYDQTRAVAASPADSLKMITAARKGLT